MHTVTHFFMHANPLLIYVLLAVVLALESTGIPVVNSTLLLFVGALSSIGFLNIWLAFPIAILGSTCGACVAYWFGFRGGRKVLLRLVKTFHLNEEKVEVAEHWYQRYGQWMIFFSRMIPYVRPFACFPAGIARMSFRRFLLLASLGSIIWCATLLAVGWSLGHRWQLAVLLLQRYTLPVSGTLIMLFAVYLIAVWLIKRRSNARYSSSHPVSKEESADHENDLLNIL